MAKSCQRWRSIVAQAHLDPANTVSGRRLMLDPKTDGSSATRPKREAGNSPKRLQSKRAQPQCEPELAYGPLDLLACSRRARRAHLRLQKGGGAWRGCGSGGGRVARSRRAGGRPTIWQDAASQSSDLEKDRCNRRLSMKRSLSSVPSGSSPPARPDPLGTEKSGSVTSKGADCTDLPPSPSFVRPHPARLSGDPPGFSSNGISRGGGAVTELHSRPTDGVR